MSRLHRRAVLTGSPLSSRVSQWTQRGIVKSIQRGTVTLTNATSATATITAVVLANASIRMLGDTPSAGSYGDTTKCRHRIELTNTTTVTVYATAADATITYLVPFEVTEYVAGVLKSVQRGSIALPSGVPTTATITAVDTTKSELAFLGSTFASNLGSNGVTVTSVVLTNGTTVTANDGYATSSAQVVGYEVREFF